MKIAEIYARLDTLSPFENQEKWDNSGLQVGSMEDEVEQIVLSIDTDMELIESLAPKTLLIVHHPIIFKPLKNLDFGTYPGNLLQKMIRKEISMIAMHTNFDLTHLNRYVAEEILDYEEVDQEGLICEMRVNQTFEELVTYISAKLSLKNPKTTKAKDQICAISLVTGSGMGLLPEVKTDCYLTGDIKFHDAMAAKSMGISLIDIGHYESERYFGECLKPHLINLPIKAIIADSKNPFSNMQEIE